MKAERRGRTAQATAAPVGIQEESFRAQIVELKLQLLNDELLLKAANARLVEVQDQIRTIEHDISAKRGALAMNSEWLTMLKAYNPPETAEK